MTKFKKHFSVKDEKFARGDFNVDVNTQKVIKPTKYYKVQMKNVKKTSKNSKFKSL